MPSGTVEMVGLILGGGEGRRLGGVIKPLLRIRNQPIIVSAIALLRPHVSQLIVSTGPFDTDRFAQFGADMLVTDAPGPHQGPLAGVFAMIRALKQKGISPKYLVCVAGDIPDLPDNLVATLKAGLKPDAPAAFAAYGGQAYPPNAVWHYDFLAAKYEEMDGKPDGMGPRQLIPKGQRCDIDFSEHSSADPFIGLNTLDDVRAYARL